ncbi:MAG: hypothetical protein H0V82_03275 [Candidatus Protochlamydia sp.]|nr:hypothetical protein [Candidatus Protochlamydia sp.]
MKNNFEGNINQYDPQSFTLAERAKKLQTQVNIAHCQAVPKGLKHPERVSERQPSSRQSPKGLTQLWEKEKKSCTLEKGAGEGIKAFFFYIFLPYLAGLLLPTFIPLVSLY